jgi:hypothetical protein
MIKKDTQLAGLLARQLLATVDKPAMAAYLLSVDTALDLLTQRLRADPERTIRELTHLANGKPLGRGGRSARRKAGRSPQAKAEHRTTKARKGGRRRKRLSAAQAEQLRTQVLAFLAKKPWSGRRPLTAAVAFPSDGLYNRIMGELKKAGKVRQKGEKSKSTYAVKGRARK